MLMRYKKYVAIFIMQINNTTKTTKYKIKTQTPFFYELYFVTV